MNKKKRKFDSLHIEVAIRRHWQWKPHKSSVGRIGDDAALWWVYFLCFQLEFKVFCE